MAVKTRAARKRRLARARAHQKKTRGTEYAGRESAIELAPWQREMSDRVAAPITDQEVQGNLLELQREYNDRMVVEGEVVPEQPTRANCPSCGFRHKVRKDGTMSRHDVFYGSDATECSGTGQRWDAVSA